MIAYIDKDGKILSCTYAETADALQGITLLPANVAYAVFVDDATNPDVEADQAEYTITNITPLESVPAVMDADGNITTPAINYLVPCATGSVTSTPIADSVKLASAQQAKIAELNTGFQATMNGGFVAKTLVGAATAPHTYPSDTTAQANFTGLVSAFTANPNKTTTMVYTIDAGWISHTKAEFFGIFTDGDEWKEAQYAQLATLEAQVYGVSTETPNFLDAIQAITWTAATY